MSLAMQSVAPQGSASALNEGARQYLTFKVAAEEYGIEILSVQEIRGYSGVSALPNTPAYIRGIMNLRGTVIPIFDLRARFRMEEQEYTRFTVVIVVRVHSKSIGLVVDAVSDVLDILPGDIRERPDCGARADINFITGIATIGEKLVVILDIAKLLTEEALSSAVV
jgi:purine-binding chemotaxis protein CheW